MSLPTKEGHMLMVLPFFPGFYESILSHAFDHYEEMEAENMAEQESSQKYYPETYQPEHLRISAAEYCELFFECTDYHKTYLKVSQFWCEAFDNWCRVNIGTPADSFVWESMVSPREYNFTTDRVFAWVPTSVVELLFERSNAEEHKVLAQVIKDNFTSYDGFSSFYSNDLESWLEKPLDEWDHNEIGTLVSAAIIASEGFENRADFSMALYELTFSGNGEEDEAWAVDWAKFEEKKAELRASKSEEQQTTKGNSSNIRREIKRVIALAEDVKP